MGSWDEGIIGMGCLLGEIRSLVWNTYRVPGPLRSLCTSWLPGNEQSPSLQTPVTMNFYLTSTLQSWDQPTLDQSSVSKMIIMQAQGPEFQPLEPTYTTRKAVHSCYPTTQEVAPLASHAHTCPYMLICAHMQTMELAHLALKLLEPDSTKSFLFLNWY